MHEGQEAPAPIDLPPMGNSQQDVLSRITRQLEYFTLNLMQRPEPPRDGDNRGQRRQNQEYHCYNCGETGHGMYNFPHPRRELGGPMPRGMYPRPPTMARPPLAQPAAAVPPVPPPQTAPPQVENRVVNVIFLERNKSEDEKSVGLEVVPVVK